MNKGKTTINMMGRWLTIILILGTSHMSLGQWWQEDFDVATNCGDLDLVRNFASTTNPNPWSITFPTAGVQDSVGGYWFVSAREAFTGNGNCGNGCQANPTLLNKTLHISTNSTGIIDQGAIYENDSITDVIAWTPAISTNGVNNLRLTFDYIEGGGNNDNGTVVFSVGGTGTPAIALDPAKTNTSCGIDGEWTRDTIYIDPTYYNQFNFHIGFRWESNGDGIGTAPSFAIDNILIEDVEPIADFEMSAETLCVGGSANFTNSSIGLNNSYAWTFTNATPGNSTAVNPQNIVFNAPGMQYIELTASNINGDSIWKDSIYIETCVPPTPAWDASRTNICVGQCIDFTDESLPGTFGKGQWQWLFQGGTPNISTDQNPTGICYQNPGTYDVTLTVADTVTGLNQQIVFTDSIVVGDCFVPIVSFTSDTQEVCNNDFVEFQLVQQGEPDEVTWIFEGGNPATITDSTHIVDTVEVYYSTPGTYKVSVIGTNPAGTGSDTIDDYITVLNCPDPIASIEANRRVICPESEVQFVDNSQYAYEWYWEFPGGQPSTSTSQFPPPITYDEPGEYPVTLIVSNVNGVDTLISEAFITVDSCKVPFPRFEIENDSICRSTCVQFFNTSKYLDITDTTDSFAWILWWHPFADSITGTAADTISAATPGYEWMATDTNLYRFDTAVFVVHEDYFPVMAPIWNFEDPILCFDDSGTIGFQMFAYNEHGVGVLNDQDLPSLNIGGAYPELRAGPDKVVRVDNIESRFYLDDTVSFDAEGTGPYFQWFPEEGLSCYDCPRPTIYPTETKKYFVTNYDDYGCQAYDSVTVFVEDAYYAGIPNIFSPNGDDNNDILWVRGNGIASEGFVMRIWDRYGNIVFESFSQNKGWDGKVKGVPGPSGSYHYYVKLIFENGTVEEMSGTVTLVRY